MVFGPFDYRPNVNIPPDVFQSLSNRYSGALSAFQEPYEKASQRVKWQQAINQVMKDKNVPQQFKMFAPFLANNQDMAGPLIQEYMKAKLTAPKNPWRVVPGMLSKSGRPIQENEDTGETREANIDVTPTGRGNSAYGTGSITWDTATPEDKQLAQALYEGRIRTGDLGYRDRSVGTKLADQYAIKNHLPPFKSYAGNVAAGTAEAFSKGKFGQNELSLNTALGHVSSAYDAYQAVGNTNQEWLNVPLNKLRQSTNDPGVVKLGITLNALRGELANVFKNSGGTDQEISSWRQYLNENLTPDQINAAIPQIDELLRSRLSALDYQRQSGMSGRGEMPLLSPHGAGISKKFSKRKLGDKQSQGWSYVGKDQ